MPTYGTQSVPQPTSGPTSWVDRAAVEGQDTLLLLARVALAAIFVQSGFGKLTDLAGFTAGLEGRGVPLASVLAPLGAVVEFFGGLALMLGAWTRPAALLVAGFTITATLIAHRFWDVPAEQQPMQTIQFMKNLAIVGGLLAVVAAGAGRFSGNAVHLSFHSVHFGSPRFGTSLCCKTFSDGLPKPRNPM